MLITSQKRRRGARFDVTCYQKRFLVPIAIESHEKDVGNFEERFNIF